LQANGPSNSTLKKFHVKDVLRSTLFAFANFKRSIGLVSFRNNELAGNTPDYANNESVKSMITVLACEVEIC